MKLLSEPGPGLCHSDPDTNSVGPNVSTTPLRQWGFQQCLPFSWTTLRSKHCRHPIAVMEVVDTFGHRRLHCNYNILPVVQEKNSVIQKKITLSHFHLLLLSASK